ncbi:MAG TPA: adenylate/guanylate cyclase domain-containing protein [Acidimicrobiia bacterium]
MTCPSCGNPAPDGARFCPACGHTLVSRPDERRIATVVFADLVGFTTFSEGNDPERVKQLVDRCFERLAADVNAYGGQVDKIVGDAIVALFGAPVAHEDDAERAVRAALQMQRTLADLRGQHQLGAEMRVGVNTGEVLVGALRAGGDYTAMGDVVNIASRLQTAAHPGQVLVGPATYGATQLRVRYESMGSIAVKGREEPVEAWLALAPVAPPGKRPSRGRSPLVGRDAEVEMLRTVLRTTVERRRAQLVLLAGEAGVGKTRLARELGRVARDDHGATVLLGHCAPYGEANVWFPVAEALRKACGIDDEDSAETVREKCRQATARALDVGDTAPEVERVAEGLLYVMGQSRTGTGVDPTRARDEAIRSVQTFLEHLSNDRPLMVLLADLHWADDLVLELVDRLMARFRTLPFLLAATARPELEDRWVPRPGRHNAVFVNLDPLEPETGADLARQLLGPDADDELVAMIVERSGGNPFFIEELVAVVSETEPETGENGDGQLPGTLRGLIAARIDALAPAERSTLEDCAVIGPAGSVELVAALAEARSGGEPELGVLASRDLLELEHNEYRFKTDIVREVAYSTLTKAERARRHAALSHLLAARATKTGRIEEVLDELAYHYGAAAELIAELGTVEGVPADLAEKAVNFLEQAAERASQQETWPVAKRLLSMALDVLDDDLDRRLRLLLYRARARTELRELFSARADLDAAVELAEARGDSRALARALIIRGDLELKENDIDASLATLDDAVERWRELDDLGGLGDALRTRGMTDLFRGELDAAAKAICEALDCFRSVEDRRGEAAALQNLAWIAFYRGELTEAEERLNESASAFAEAGDWGGLGWALGLLAWVRFNQGDLDEAERLASDVFEESRDIDNRWASAIMQVLLANIALWRGESHAAIERAEGALELFRDMDDAWGTLQSLAPLCRALACLGRVAEANLIVDEMSETALEVPDTSIRQFPFVCRANIAVHSGSANALQAASEMDDRSEGYDDNMLAERGIIHALATLQAGGARGAVSALEGVRLRVSQAGPAAAAAAALALAYDACGQADDAMRVCEEVGDGAVTYLDQLQLVMARGFASVQLGDPAGAEQCFWRALEIADRTESRLDQALARLARARAWAALDRPDVAEAEHEATVRLDALAIDGSRWDAVFRMAATGGT